MFGGIIFFKEDEGTSHELVVEDTIKVTITEVEVVGIFGERSVFLLETRFYHRIRLIKFSYFSLFAFVKLNQEYPTKLLVSNLLSDRMSNDKLLLLVLDS